MACAHQLPDFASHPGILPTKIIACILSGLSGLAFSAGFPDPASLASSYWSAIRVSYEAERHAIWREQTGTLSARSPGQYQGLQLIFVALAVERFAKV